MHELLYDRPFYICVGVVASSIYLWNKFFITYRSTNKKLSDLQLFHERHNCVVMYARKYLRGWPPYTDGILINDKNTQLVLEPFLYFINHAQESLDIAMMTMKIPQILESLMKVKQRGVNVRVILNYNTVGENVSKYVKIKNSGIKVLFYITKNEYLDSIMHYKYMIKDYRKDNGFVCMGSANLPSTSTLMSNYEDVIFSSNLNLVSKFHANFEQCWQMIETDNEKIFNKSILKEANLL